MYKIAFAEPNREGNAIRAIAKSIIAVLQEISATLSKMIRDKRRDKKFELYAKEKIVEAKKWYDQHKKYEDKIKEVLRILSYIEAILTYLRALEQDYGYESGEMQKRDHTIVLSPAHYNVTPGKFRPSVFRRFGIGLGIGAMLGGYAGYKLGRRGGKKMKKSVIEYVRIQVKTPDGIKSFWAEVRKRTPKMIQYKVVDKEGDLQNHIVIAAPSDVISEKPAIMNLHYGELEIKKSFEANKNPIDKEAHDWDVIMYHYAKELVNVTDRLDTNPKLDKYDVIFLDNLGSKYGEANEFLMLNKNHKSKNMDNLRDLMGDIKQLLNRVKSGLSSGTITKRDTIVITDIHKSGFFCPYCSATLILKNPMDDAVHCKCGKNFTVILKYVMHPKDKHMGADFDPYDEFEKIGLPIIPLENIKAINTLRSRFSRLWHWRHKKEEAKKEEPVAKVDRTVEQVKRAIRRAEERTMRAGKRTLPAFGRPAHPTAESDYQKELDELNRLRGELNRVMGGMQKGFPIAPIASIADDVALYGYYGYKKHKQKRKQMRQAQSQRRGG